MQFVAINFFACYAAFPFIYTNNRRQVINWTTPADDWDIAKVPRSITPHVAMQRFPNRINTEPADSDAAFLAKLKRIKENQSMPRLLWYDTSMVADGLNYPPFVDKALKLFNLKQVAYEIENSVMSKVSCTACKAGAGLLQHYIKSGKSDVEIIKLIFQFCVNLNIQSPRVCEGVSRLFGSEVIYVLQRVNLGPDEICSFVIGDACGDVYNPYHEWEVIFPPVPKVSRLL